MLVGFCGFGFSGSSSPGWLGIVLIASCQRWVQWGVLGGCLWLVFVALA
ncbi:hypothetical protein Acr_01g0000270 [Actinidia rufa]|uniref:Uncharacterized protein n=1 Tax=Actinidia rufa TaxID=165716 RepID=A0A7J0E1E2_9ERIC|nr:hypothetical protein Acr_01g0000270 [Actinidia rufa]